MAKFAYLYNIGFFTNDGKGVMRSVPEFFSKLENLLDTDPEKIIRKFDEDTFRVFKFYHNDPKDIIVIPFGKFIKKNRPYTCDEKDSKSLVELKEDMYDINSLVYSTRHHAMMYTTNQKGPNDLQLCKYFNTFINKKDGCDLQIKPILFNKTLEEIRNSPRVTSILISVDLGQDINNFFNSQITEDKNLIKTLIGLFSVGKDDIDGRYIKLNIGLGRGKKDLTLNKDSVLELIGDMNIESPYIKEIELRYADAKTEKIELIKLKNGRSKVKAKFTTHDSKLGPEYLNDKADEAFLAVREHFIEQVRIFREDFKIEDKGEHKLNEEWREEKSSN